jgi:1,4-dihydroxy-2-naphthoate octaprenyltransferase
VAALVAALLLQIGSNLANDLFDFDRGADTEARIGPPRAMQMGLLSRAQMRAGIGIVFALAIAVGFYLLSVAGWPVAIVGLLSVAAALAYTGGPWPFGYKGFGDPAVFLFFGVIAVVGTNYVQSLRLSPDAFFASLSVGALATAILVVNNVRDIETDRVAGKYTLAVRLGRKGARVEYATLIGTAYALLPVYWLGCGRSVFVLAPLLSIPMAWPLVRTIFEVEDGPTLNAALAGTAKLCLVFSLLLAVGWLV